jgi:hypothetical protein
MPTRIDVEQTAAKNPKIDLDEFRKGEDALKALRESGTVKRSTYDLGTPESKQYIRPAREEDGSPPECLPAFRRLR